ncbi:daunorubicin resistance protein DrrA family ABC transporter ATP-binding protein [Methanobrevibacter arboriphilus]|jgi:ABC-2 type transport system ATP-binding protein|uniref:Daunorubicin resistance protein DrrA family ABC transporter ATP-binding protein n=1 Tax=Methanobrevibacter arboriphilus TaxID=39441 RepID=A0ACA8R586_METAZ|nr:ATP-binding cassette domain-containing protein [Methanobrevibacter arboriphilus]BBL62598.1 daunorubicin resistance protein DrrA family ABC transporter ATP-binding protein [Methanobrevibacter arboriphilus]GLI12677.1 daunorubicin resistance protein DrrA family ABC transporter ATP-binding protein [Methanobrevibacter arboriphilus]
MSYIIETDNITKDFGDFRAVNSINLKVPRNSVYGVLGPNGAGKSTLISMLCTILAPTSGTAKINGYDIVKEANDVRKSIGIVFQTRALDDILTGREHLEMHAALYGVPNDVRQDRIDEVLELIALGSKADEETKNYSGGMRRRLEIGRGLVHHPKLLFLDEPTLGLDIQTRESIWKYIEDLKNSIDITILLTTHYLEEVDNLCDDLSIIDQGEIIKSGNPKNLKAELKSDTVTLVSPEISKLCDIMENQPFVKDIIKKDDEIRLMVEKGEDLIPKIVKIANDNNIKITSIELKHPSLEEVFIKYTGRKIGDSVKIRGV